MTKPALTAEEWAVAAKNLDWDMQTALMIPVKELPGGADIVEVSGLGDLLDIPRDTRHHLAARLLHGQPFGFTREDVEEVRRQADLVERFVEPGPGGERANRRVRHLRSLADRIEALLPPEGE